jgi:hypothetical protein
LSRKYSERQLGNQLADANLGWKCISRDTDALGRRFPAETLPWLNAVILRGCMHANAQLRLVARLHKVASGKGWDHQGVVNILADSERRGSLMPGKRYEGDDSTQGAIEGKYANYFQIGHNAFEFLLDFGQLYADGKGEQIHTRIVTSPSYAKELLKVLGESVEQYEKNFGPIKHGE